MDEPTNHLDIKSKHVLKEALKQGAEIIGFIDDDEFPDSNWLFKHMEAMKSYAADVVTGPVIPLNKSGSAATDSSHKIARTGTKPRTVATNNVFFSTKLIVQDELEFDPLFRL